MTPPNANLAQLDADLARAFDRLGVRAPRRGDLICEDPSRGRPLASIEQHDAGATDRVIASATQAFTGWRNVPGPVRGEVVRRLGETLRAHKDDLAAVVTAEVGKGVQEARGEVQEMIDICDFAVGLSRTLGGKTLLSERAGHRMMELWHPLGPVACISAFNFPVAVWSWNAAIALVCGNPVIWKPSTKAALTAWATHQLMQPVLAAAGHPDVLQLVWGPDATVGETLVRDPRVPLVSATGSCAMGRKVAPLVAARLGRTLLELGGNNAVIVERSADIALATRAIAFGAAGTAGQRCTTTRRLFVEASVAGELTQQLVKAYAKLQTKVGDPRNPNNLIGPLIDADAREAFLTAVGQATAAGGKVLAGGEVMPGDGYFVQPTLIEVPNDGPFPVMNTETFAPILYLRTFPDGELHRAISWQNDVEQGLSSALFSDSMHAAERFLSPNGSDCGIANVNLGTSGAEIGGAFGGEKATGGGRESGSDAWKAYMRRQTVTINGSGDLPLAQGIEWD